MKVFVAICVLTTVVTAAPAGNLTPEQNSKLVEYHKACLNSTKVNSETVTKARKGDFPDDDNKLDEYFSCMFKKCDFIDDNGQLKTEVIKQKVPTNATDVDVNKAINSCAKVQNEPKEKIAKLAYKCFLTESPVKIQILPDTV